MTKSIIFARPTSLSAGINRSFFLSYISSQFSAGTIHRTGESSPSFIYPQFRTQWNIAGRDHRGSSSPLSRARAGPKFFAVSLAPEAHGGRCSEVRNRVGPKKVYRKMAARIYVIRGRRLFPSFLHLLYTRCRRRHHLLLRDSMGSATAWSWNDPTAEKAFA